MADCLFVMGATSSIAQALISKASKSGWQVVAAGRDAAKLEELYGNQANVVCAVAQATDSSSVNACFDDIAAKGLQVTRYAHCVGSILVAPLTRTTDQQLQDVLEVNLISALYGTRKFLQACKQHKQAASAVLVSTCATGIGVGNHEAIAAAKAGVEGLARSAAATHAPDNIRINVVAPGLTDSAIAAPLLKSEVMRAASAKQYPLNGINTPEEVANAMFWLLSDESCRTTGSVLNIDGGFRNIRPLVK